MKSIYKLLEENLQEAIEILKIYKDNTIYFAVWDENNDCYHEKTCDGEIVKYGYCDDACPWIRFADDDGNITPQMVVAARFREGCDIEILTTENVYTQSDNQWFNILWADDISYHTVLEKISFYAI